MAANFRYNSFMNCLIRRESVVQHKYPTHGNGISFLKDGEDRVGPDIWGLQNRAKGPKYFSKKGYFGHKKGPQKPNVKEFSDVEEHFTSKK